MATKKKKSKSASFLHTTWPELVAKGRARRSKKPISAPIVARFTHYGFVPPPGVRELLVPLDTHEAPPLLDFEAGTYAPEPKPSAPNQAEALLRAARDYVPLWAEIFASVFELGSTGNGDIWMVAVDPLSQKEEFVYLFNHETDELEGPAAVDVESFAVAQAACATKATKDIAALKESLDGRVDPALFDDALDVEPFAPEAENPQFMYLRAAWLIALLNEEDPSDAEIRGNFTREMNSPVDDALLAKRKPLMLTYAPTAFYTCLAAYFGGDTKIATKAAEHVKKSKIPIIHDLGTLILELLAGTRKKIGALANVPKLRERVLALDLWAAPKKTKKTPEDKVLDALFHRDGMRAEAALAAFTKKKDLKFVPRLIERIASGSDGRPAFMDILRNWREPSAITPLAAVAREADRFSVVRNPYLDLVFAAGGPEHAPIVIDALAFLGPKVKGDDEYLEAPVVRALLTLGKHGGEKAVDAALRFTDSKAKRSGNSAGISVRDAALWAASELGTPKLLPDLVKRMKTEEMTATSPGFRWALGRLGANADAKTKAAILKRLDEVRLDDIDGLYYDEDEISAAIALEHARVLLGAPNKPLAKFIGLALKNSDNRSIRTWALLALRAQKDIDPTPARKLLKSDQFLVRTLAEELFAKKK